MCILHYGGGREVSYDNDGQRRRGIVTTRRSFISGAASAAGAFAVGGCATQSGESSFYGPTIRDRLWMWGHHVDSAKRAGSCATDKALRKTFKWKGPALDVPAVNLSKKWIAAHGEDRVGTRRAARQRMVWGQSPVCG